MVQSGRYYTISNEFVSKENLKLKVLGSDCFALYNFLLLNQGLEDSGDFSIKQIIAYFNRDSNYKLRYGNKEVKVSKLKDVRIIKRCIAHLIRLNYIVSDINLDTCNINSVIIYNIDICKIRDDTNYSRINNELFKDYIYKIGHIGWSIYFVLYRLHNENFGGEMSKGYANPSIEYIMACTGLSNKTIISYIALLENCKYIKVDRSEPVFSEYDKDGKSIFKTPANQYTVGAKCPNNKYYIV